MSELRPLKAIRAKCLDCCGGSYDEVKYCIITGCVLWSRRFGRRAESLPDEMKPLLRADLMKETINMTREDAARFFADKTQRTEGLK